MARILIVEDDRVVNWHIQETLENLGHTVVGIAVTAPDAIKTAEAERPELVLMDIRLKGRVDGITAAEEIYQRFDIPVIYLTAYSDQATLQRAKNSAPFGYLVKPIREQDLQTTIEVVLHRHQLEHSLKVSQQWFATTLSSLGDGAIATDLDGNVTFINPAAEDLTGWQREEAIGQPVTNILNLINRETREPIENPLLQAMQQRSKVRLDQPSLLLTRDGFERPIGDSATPITTSQGEMIGSVLVFQSTDGAETQLDTEAELLNQLKDDFLSSISHELRTPLTNMRMAVEMLRRIIGRLKSSDGQPDSEANAALLWQRMEQYVQVLYEEWQQEFDLITDLLEFQNADTPREPLLFVAIDLQQWFPQIINRFAERAVKQRQSLTYDIDDNLSTCVTHPQSLERLVSELLHNAVKYTPPGRSIALLAESTRRENLEQSSSSSVTNVLQIKVQNTGVVIPPEEHDRIFQPFYRIIQPHPWNYGGTGLGLAMVKKLVTRLEGTVHVESDTEATRFVVKLPLLG